MATWDYYGSKFRRPGTTVGLLHYCDERCARFGKMELYLAYLHWFSAPRAR
jgi:hypothetical protein